MRDLSIRLRLTIWYAVVLLFGLALFGVGMWYALQGRLVAGVDTRLAQRMQGIRAAELAKDGGTREHLEGELAEFTTDVPDGSLIQLRTLNGELIVPFPGQRPFTNVASAPATVQRDGKRFRIGANRLAYAGQTFDVLVAAPLDEVDAVMRDFRNLLLLMIPAVLAVACLGGYWLSVRALRPVDEITTVAKSIGVQNLSQRLTAPRTSDELQRMAEAWNEVLERLDGSVKRIRQFTADASHELRTPLALIRATAELALRRERDPEEYRKSLQAIEGEAKRMTALTESLLEMARSDANQFNMVPAPANMNDIIGRVVDQNGALATEKGVTLKAESNGQPAVANVDESSMQRLLLILIDNALKHTPAGGSVTVSARKNGVGVVLQVADTGEGIAAESLPHVFERFYRSDPARGDGSGFGLGLSIAQAIAQAHSSRITVESSPGAGARFTLALKS